MDVKIELGKKIRMLREEKQLSREKFCADEVLITVRQLTRIEKGESLPTLPKISFISKRLDVSISFLVDNQYIELPKRYIELKNLLYTYGSYKQENRILEREKIFDEIYNTFYDNLPEEEQLSIDIQQAAEDVHLSSDVSFGKPIIQDYFEQLQKKTTYTEIDLLLIDLYFFCAVEQKYDEDIFELILERAIEQVDLFMEKEAFLLIKIIIGAMDVYSTKNYYEKFGLLIQVANVIMTKNQDYRRKPIIDMLEGKYLLLQIGDLSGAKEKYKEAALFAKLVGDMALSEKINEEWILDSEFIK